MLEPNPLVILVLGMLTVLGLIIFARLNAFLALIIAALLVSFLAAGNVAEKVGRVASAFGTNAGNIGIVIALASIIGKCMLDSGAADRIVRAFTSALGEKRAPLALMGSGFVLAIPVFFDTVFYLLVPLARSLFKRTNKNYLRYLIAIGAGGAITHTLVPPTPGPLLIAANLGVDPGMMIMMGLVVAIVPATLGLVFGAWIDRVMPVPMRPIGAQVEIPSLSDAQLPSLWLSLLPVALPVLLISTNTVLKVYADAEPTAVLRAEDVQFDKLQTQLSAQLASSEPTPGKVIVAAWPEELRSSLDAGHVLTQAQEAAMLAELNKLLKSKKFYNDELFFGISLNPVAKSLDKKAIERLGQADLMRLNRALLESLFPSAIAEHVWETPRRQAADWSSLFGNANLALLISALIAMGTMAATRNLSRVDVAVAVEDSLMSGGVIILITAAGGAFGEMLKVAKVGQEIEKMCAGVGSGSSAGLMLLLLAFGVAAVFKVAQGSTTVSMITTSGMLASLASVEILGFHPVYLATAIGCGGLMGSWMNDSGFWVFAKMGGLTEAEALKSWTILLVIMSLAGLAVTLILATLLPLKGAA